MRAAALLMGLLMITAGCVGGGDGSSSADVAASGEVVDTNTSASGDDLEDNHSHEAAPEPHWDNRTGELQGYNAVFFSNALGNETISLPDTSTRFDVTLTAENGEINGELYPPDCQDDDAFFGEECSHSMNTYNGTTGTYTKDGGQATFSTESPQGGNWTLRLFKADPGTNSVPYTITFHYVDEHKPSADHHS